MLHVVADQVAHREPVVSGDEVDRGLRGTTVVLEHVGGTGKPGGELLDPVNGALPVVAHVITEPVVPLRPTETETAELIPVGADVPGFGDQLHPGERRVGVDLLLQGMVMDEMMLAVAEQGGSQIETEPVDPHVLHPVTQGVDYQLPHHRRGGVHRVPAAGHVVVIPQVIGETVVARVVDAAHGQRRTLVPALRGVVVDDVEDHLYAGVVEGGDHGLELRHLGPEGAPGGVVGVRGEITEGVVAPVVAQPLVGDERLGCVVVDGQQFHRRDAGVKQIGDHVRVGQCRIRAAQVLGHQRVHLRETAHVHLVDDRLRHRTPTTRYRRRCRGVGDDDAERHGPEGISGVGAEIVVGQVIVDRAPVVDAAGHGPGVGVEQQPGRIETAAAARRPVPVHAVAVLLPLTDTGNEGVPDSPAVLPHFHVSLVLHQVHERQLHAFGVGGPQTEADAVLLDLCSQAAGVERLNEHVSPSGPRWASAPRAGPFCHMSSDLAETSA